MSTNGDTTNEYTSSNNTVPKTFEVVNNEEIIATVYEKEIKGKELNELFTLLQFDGKKSEYISNTEKKHSKYTYKKN
ncbi:hypothetical protein V1503_24575 [Bacillus sp. SCS-151]|uniref:hypothetical protein n=1 Tax=Nanhaiella sioensis TaxID=3115293 RepID=UPI00397CFB74